MKTLLQTNKLTYRAIALALFFTASSFSVFATTGVEKVDTPSHITVDATSSIKLVVGPNPASTYTKVLVTNEGTEDFVGNVGIRISPMPFMSDGYLVVKRNVSIPAGTSKSFTLDFSDSFRQNYIKNADSFISFSVVAVNTTTYKSVSERLIMAK